MGLQVLIDSLVACAALPSGILAFCCEKDPFVCSFLAYHLLSTLQTSDSQPFENLAAHIEKDKFKNYLLTYNTQRKIVYDNKFKYAK